MGARKSNNQKQVANILGLEYTNIQSLEESNRKT